MALINCPECEKQISDKADKCTYCGFPLKKDQTAGAINNKDSSEEFEPQNRIITTHPRKTNRNIILGILLITTISFLAYFFIFNYNSIFHKKISLIPYLKNNGKYIFVDSTNMKPAFEKEYDMLFPFSEEVARFQQNGKWGLIDKTGKEIISFNCSKIYEFIDGKARIEYEFQHYGLIDKTGNVIFQKQFIFGDFSEGLTAITSPIDINNITTIDPSLPDNSRDLGFMNMLGEVVIPQKYSFASDFSEGLAPVGIGTSYWHEGGNYTFSGKFGFIDHNGNEIIPLIFEDAEKFSEGLAKVKYNGKYGFINKSGEVVIPYRYDIASSFSEGMAVVNRNGKYGYINNFGSVIIQMKYDFAEDFHDGFAIVNDGIKSFYIDKNESILAIDQYEYIQGFQEGIAIVGRGSNCYNRDGSLCNGKYGCIDKGGKEVIALTYDDLFYFNNGLALVSKNEKSYYIDKSGKEYKDN